MARKLSKEQIDALAEKNRKYWGDREDEALKHYIKDEKQYDRQIEKIYRDMLDGIQKEIDGFYGRYASKEGISINEAKKRVTEADIKAYERKAKRYVKDAALDRKANNNKTNKKGYYFSKQANEEMRLYNLTMKVNRLEMLKANIGLDLIKGHDELEKYMAEILQGRTTEELERQAGILGNTITINSKMAHAIPNSSFHNAKFSDRIWMHQDLLKADLSKLLQTGLIQGKNPRVLAREIETKFNTSRYNAERLMRTELARVQTEVQKASLERNGFTQFEFLANSKCCDICQEKNKKIFKLDGFKYGDNAPPLHPHCVLPDTKIIAPDAEAITKSEYSGDVIELRTANGARLTVTANHIMLTARGWVRAKSIVEGDKVIRYCSGAESMLEPNPADDNSVPTIEQLFAACVEASAVPPLRVPATAEHFKGDVIPDSEVDVVFIDRELRNKLDPSVKKFVSDVLLVGASVGGEFQLAVGCSLAKLLVGLGLTSDGIMSGLDVAAMLFGGSVSHHELVGFRRPSDYYARLNKTAVNNISVDTELFSKGVLAHPGFVQADNFSRVDVMSGSPKFNSVAFKESGDGVFATSEGLRDLVGAFPGVVTFDDVVFVSSKFYSGHVYDTSSMSTLYIANGLLSSNCRCAIAPFEDTTEFDAWLDHVGSGGETTWDNWKKLVKRDILKRNTLKIDIQHFAKRSEDFETVILPKQEYAHVMSEIATNLTEEQANKKVFSKAIGDYIYTVENNGFGDYRVIKKIKIEEDL